MSRRPSRGIVLITLLVLMVIVAMLTGVLLKRSQMGLYGTSHYRDSIRSEQAARGGVNHLLALLDDDNSYSSELNISLGDSSYQFSFDPSEENFSVNNLTGGTTASQTSAQGYKVLPHAADLIVTGRCGITQTRLRVVVHQGLSPARSVMAVGKVSLDGNVKISGVKSLLPPENKTEPEPAPGGITSKYQSPNAGDPAISWSSGGGSTFELDELSRLESAPAKTGGEAVSPELKSLFPDQVVDKGAADHIPDIDVEAKVGSASSHPLPALVSGGSGTYSAANDIAISDDRYVAGDLSITGNLDLLKGSLYVDGDLEIVGGIRGTGTIYVKGDVLMRGGTSVVQTSQESGAALMVGGDVRFEGISAAGYLQSLAVSHPDVGLSFQDLQNQLSTYPSAEIGLGTWRLSLILTKHAAGSPGSKVGNAGHSAGEKDWVQPIPSPNGGHVLGHESAIIPSLLAAIKNTGAHLTDPRARKVVGALEEIAFHFRDNDVWLPSFLDSAGNEIFHLQDDYTIRDPLGNPIVGNDHLMPSDGWGEWDDSSLLLENRTHNSIFIIPTYVTFEQRAAHEGRRAAYLANNPLDFSWLGDSTFQGIVYARGSVSAEHRFKVIGSLISLQDITLTNGVTLIFNEEYRSFFGATPPIGIVHYEQL